MCVFCVCFVCVCFSMLLVDVVVLFCCFLFVCGVFLFAFFFLAARCSSVVRAFAHYAMDRRIDPSWGGPIELFLVPPSAPRLV